MQPNQVLMRLNFDMHLIQRAENDKRASSAQSLIAKVGHIKIYKTRQKEPVCMCEGERETRGGIIRAEESKTIAPCSHWMLGPNLCRAK